MTLEEYRRNNSGQGRSKRSFKNFVLKFTLSVFILLSILSICKLSPDTKKLINEELFQTNFNFSKINSLFSKVLPVEQTVNVNDEGIKYRDYLPYQDGVKISMNEGESVNLIDSGIVVYIGWKEGYGNTIIVQQSNGVDVWYGNVDDVSVNLYDYLNKNTIVGTSKETLYLVFQKNGEFLDYKNYI